MSGLTSTQKDALHVLRVRLNPNDPANRATDEVKEHLRAIRLWLDSWVLPAIEAVEPKAPRWLVDSVKQDAASMRRTRAPGESPQLEAIRLMGQFVAVQGIDDKLHFDSVGFMAEMQSRSLMQHSRPLTESECETLRKMVRIYCDKKGVVL